MLISTSHSFRQNTVKTSYWHSLPISAVRWITPRKSHYHNHHCSHDIRLGAWDLLNPNWKYYIVSWAEMLDISSCFGVSFISITAWDCSFNTRHLPLSQFNNFTKLCFPVQVGLFVTLYTLRTAHDKGTSGVFGTLLLRTKGTTSTGSFLIYFAPHCYSSSWSELIGPSLVVLPPNQLCFNNFPLDTFGFRPLQY